MVAASLGLANSGSRSEDRFWEQQLARLLDRVLDAAHSATITSALERLNQTDGEAYGALVEAVEHAAETVVVEPTASASVADGLQVQPGRYGLLLTAPLVAWTRFAIPSGAVTPQVAQTLSPACGRNWCSRRVSCSGWSRGFTVSISCRGSFQTCASSRAS